MLIGAGSETTTNLLSGLLLTLAQRPDVFTQLREHPELIPAAIEEQLRFVSPVQGFYRTATRDYTVGAQTIPAGARVLLLFAAANRDPRRFDDPTPLTSTATRPTTSPSAAASTTASARLVPTGSQPGL